MKFNIFMTIQGPVAPIEAPSTSNPVECEDMGLLLRAIANKFDQSTPIEAVNVPIKLVGIRIEQAND